MDAPTIDLGCDRLVDNYDGTYQLYCNTSSETYRVDPSEVVAYFAEYCIDAIREELPLLLVVEGQTRCGKTILARMMGELDDNWLYVSYQNPNFKFPRRFTRTLYCLDEVQLRADQALDEDLKELRDRRSIVFLFVQALADLPETVRSSADVTFVLAPGVVYEAAHPHKRAYIHNQQISE